MAVSVTSGLVIPSSSTLASASYAFLKAEVCVAVDGETDPVQLTKAGRAINRVIRMLNLKDAYEFNRLQAVDADLVSGTQDYSISDTALIVDEVQLINTDSEVASTLDFHPWEDVNQRVGHQNDTGVPRWWTLYNRVRSKAIRLYAVPDDSAATNYDLRIHTRSRINALSSDTDTVIGPNELTEVLVSGGEYLMLYWRERKNPAAWGSARARFMDNVYDLARVDQNMAGKIPSFRIDYEE